MSFTLLTPCQYREEIRKSRFLALAAPVSSAEQAQAFIASQREASASHHCWAWKVGQQYRFSDDGEPGGTAGRPILAAIEGQDMDHVVVLVIRWYGGIQLGTGGLARAYGGSASKCLQGGERVARVAQQQVSLHCPFAELALVKARLAECAGLITDERFDAHGALLSLSVPQAHLDALQQALADLSRGRLVLQPGIVAAT